MNLLDIKPINVESKESFDLFKDVGGMYKILDFEAGDIIDNINMTTTKLENIKSLIDTIKANPSIDTKELVKIAVNIADALEFREPFEDNMDNNQIVRLMERMLNTRIEKSKELVKSVLEAMSDRAKEATETLYKIQEHELIIDKNVMVNTDSINKCAYRALCSPIKYDGLTRFRKFNIPNNVEIEDILKYSDSKFVDFKTTLLTPRACSYSTKDIRVDFLFKVNVKYEYGREEDIEFEDGTFNIGELIMVMKRKLDNSVDTMEYIGKICGDAFNMLTTDYIEGGVSTYKFNKAMLTVTYADVLSQYIITMVDIIEDLLWVYKRKVG